MNIIQPLGSFYLVTHTDLIKFGIDMTQKAKQSLSSKIDASIVNSTIFSANLPQISCAFKPKKTIKIRKKNKTNYDEIDVDIETGIIIDEHESFTFISKFDPKSFPTKDQVTLDQVSYWDSLNKYVKRK